jgi:shikimate kinase
MNIVLIGYRGTGKSVVGELLSRKLNRETISMDAEIVKKAGMKKSRHVNPGVCGTERLAKVSGP